MKWTLPNGDSAYFEINNRGKKSLTIDLTKEKGKQVLYRLVKNSDVFVHNFRQGVPEKLQMDYETLSKYNPKLIYAAASGYGPNGPEAREPVYDFVGLARSGIMNMVGEPEIIPQPIYGGIGDQIGGIMTGYGVLVALLVRERMGIGQKVDVSQLGSLMMLEGLAVNSQLIYAQRLILWKTGKRSTIRFGTTINAVMGRQLCWLTCNLIDNGRISVKLLVSSI